MQVLLGVGVECKVHRCSTSSLSCLCPRQWPEQAQPAQVVLIVAQHLGMGLGKTAAQCAHACLGLYKQMASSHLPQLQAWEVEPGLQMQ